MPYFRKTNTPYNYNNVSNQNYHYGKGEFRNQYKNGNTTTSYTSHSMHYRPYPPTSEVTGYTKRLFFSGDPRRQDSYKKDTFPNTKVSPTGVINQSDNLQDRKQTSQPHFITSNKKTEQNEGQNYNLSGTSKTSVPSETYGRKNESQATRINTPDPPTRSHSTTGGCKSPFTMASTCTSDIQYQSNGQGTCTNTIDLPTRISKANEGNKSPCISTSSVQYQTHDQGIRTKSPDVLPRANVPSRDNKLPATSTSNVHNQIHGQGTRNNSPDALPRANVPGRDNKLPATSTSNVPNQIHGQGTRTKSPDVLPRANVPSRDNKLPATSTSNVQYQIHGQGTRTNSPDALPRANVPSRDNKLPATSTSNVQNQIHGQGTRNNSPDALPRANVPSRDNKLPATSTSNVQDQIHSQGSRTNSPALLSRANVFSRDNKSPCTSSDDIKYKINGQKTCTNTLKRNRATEDNISLSTSTSNVQYKANGHRNLTNSSANIHSEVNSQAYTRTGSDVAPSGVNNDKNTVSTTPTNVQYQISDWNNRTQKIHISIPDVPSRTTTLKKDDSNTFPCTGTARVPSESEGNKYQVSCVHITKTPMDILERKGRANSSDRNVPYKNSVWENKTIHVGADNATKTNNYDKKQEIPRINVPSNGNIGTEISSSNVTGRKDCEDKQICNLQNKDQSRACSRYNEPNNKGKGCIDERFVSRQNTKTTATVVPFEKTSLNNEQQKRNILDKEPPRHIESKIDWNNNHKSNYSRSSTNVRTHSNTVYEETNQKSGVEKLYPVYQEKAETDTRETSLEGRDSQKRKLDIKDENKYMKTDWEDNSDNEDIKNNTQYGNYTSYKESHGETEEDFMDRNPDELLLSMQNRRIKINHLLAEQKRLMKNLNAMKSHQSTYNIDYDIKDDVHMNEV